MVVVQVRVKGARGRNIETIQRNLRNGMPGAMKAIGEVLHEDAMQAFEQERSPTARGGAWPAKSQVTREIEARGGLHARTGGRTRRVNQSRAAGAGGSKLLRDRGTLRQSIVVKSGRFIARIAVTGAARAYARVQQFGNPKNRLPNRAGGRRAPIPARPYLQLRRDGTPSLSKEVMTEITETFRDALVRAGRRR